MTFVSLSDADFFHGDDRRDLCALVELGLIILLVAFPSIARFLPAAVN